MVALVLAAVATLTLDAPSATWSAAACHPSDELADCKISHHRVAGARLTIVSMKDGMGDYLSIVLGASLFDLARFDRANNHHSESWLDERARRLRITAGALDGGDRAVVVLVDIVATLRDNQTWKARSVDHAASIVVCDLDQSTCTRPERVACRARGCTTSLADGTLTVRGAQKHRVTYDVRTP